MTKFCRSVGFAASISVWKIMCCLPKDEGSLFIKKVGTKLHGVINQKSRVWMTVLMYTLLF